MSRSRMGVGLEEPRGERSWLSKSWNSLQICLTDRRWEGRRGWEGFTICLQHNRGNLCLFPSFTHSPLLMFSYTHPHHFGSTHVKMCPKKHLKKPAAEKFNADAEAKAKHLCNTTLNIQLSSPRSFF